MFSSEISLCSYVVEFVLLEVNSYNSLLNDY